MTKISKLVSFLKTHKPVHQAIQTLKKKYGIKCHKHPIHRELILFKYNQLNADWNQGLVQECRGIIINVKTMEIVSYPFEKFFNYQEIHCDEINWEKAIVSEKLDGSIMTLYNYKDEWNVSSSSLPDAQRKQQGKNNLGDLFWNIWKTKNYSMPASQDLCYMFEMCSVDRKVFIPHAEDKIVLIGCRDLETLREIDPKIIASQQNWETAKIFPYKSLDQVISASFTLNPLVQEGFVVCDDRFHRIKVKSPQYVALNLLESSGKNQFQQMCQIVRTNESSEFLSYFPQYRDLYDEVKQGYGRFIHQLRSIEQSELERLRFQQSLTRKRREFIEKIQKKASKTTIEEALKLVDLNMLEYLCRNHSQASLKEICNLSTDPNSSQDDEDSANESNDSSKESEESDEENDDQSNTMDIQSFERDQPTRRKNWKQQKFRGKRNLRGWS